MFSKSLSLIGKRLILHKIANKFSQYWKHGVFLRKSRSNQNKDEDRIIFPAGQRCDEKWPFQMQMRCVEYLIRQSTANMF